MRTYAWLPGEIADGRRIVRVDLRGHGRSEHAPGTYDVDRYGEDVVERAARDGGPARGARRPFAGRRRRLVGGPAPPRARRRRLPRGPAAVHGRARRARAQRRGPDLPAPSSPPSRAGRRRASTPSGRRRAGRGAVRPRPLAHAAEALCDDVPRAGRGAAAHGPRRARGRDRPLDARPHRHHLARLGARLPAGRRRRQGRGLPDAPRRAPGHHRTPTWRSSASPGAGHGIHDERDHRARYVAALARFLATHA